MKRIFSILLVLALLAGLATAFAEESGTVSTSLESASDAKRSNLAIAAAKLDGYVVAQGAAFSFNEVVGPRSAAYGYATAPNGRGVNVTGGGVAQAAATLYLALRAAGADVTYTQLRVYGADFADDYVSDPGDAVMVDYAAGLDFSFVNNGGDLTLEMWSTERRLYCAVSAREAESFSFIPWSLEQDTRSGAPAASASFALEGSDALISNVTLAAESINDTVLDTDDLFSFNGIVGPREQKYGYQSAVNGRGVKVVGGGVAQVASVVWLAVKQLDCAAIVEKSTYGGRYNQHYVETSNDAILTDYTGHTDFSFRNTAPSPMTISTYVRGGVLHCDIYLG